MSLLLQEANDWLVNHQQALGQLTEVSFRQKTKDFFVLLEAGQGSALSAFDQSWYEKFKPWARDTLGPWLNQQDTSVLPTFQSLPGISDVPVSELRLCRFEGEVGLPWRMCVCFSPNQEVGYVVVPRKYWRASPNQDGRWQDYPSLDEDYSAARQVDYAQVRRRSSGLELIKRGKIVRG